MVVRGESGGVKTSYVEVSGKIGKVVFLLYAVVSSIFTLIALNLFLGLSWPLSEVHNSKHKVGSGNRGCGLCILPSV